MNNFYQLKKVFKTFDNNIAFINLATLEEFFGLSKDEQNLEVYLKNPQNIESQKEIGRASCRERV